MKRMGTTLLLLIFFLPALAAERKPYELIGFDYSEISVETENAVRIEWSGKVESNITYNGQFQVVLTVVMANRKAHTFATNPIPLQGMGQAEISDTFVVPRELWDTAEEVDVAATEVSNGVGVEQSSEPSQKWVDCIKNEFATPGNFQGLADEIAELKDEIYSRELETLITEALVRQQRAPQASADGERELLERVRKRVDDRLALFMRLAEDACRDLQ